MYTFLGMDMIDFKNRMKMFDYYMCFNRIRPLRVGRKERNAVEMTLVGCKQNLIT